MSNKLSVAILAWASLCAAIAPAAAGRYSYYVTAESDYGNGSVRGPVRSGQFGLEVRLPGGTWMNCTKSGLLQNRYDPCSETLRRETVDFWENQRDSHGGSR